MKQQKMPHQRTRRFSFDTFIGCFLDDNASALGQHYDALSKCIVDGNLREYVEKQLQLTEASQFVSGGAELYIVLRQLSAFLEKNVDYMAANSEERFAAGLEKFFKTETKCRITNKRLSRYRRRPLLSKYREESQILEEAALIIQEILGDLTPEMMERVFGNMKHGSGATTQHRRDAASAYDKIHHGHGVTANAKPLLIDYLRESPDLFELLARQGESLTIEMGDVLFAVPKKYNVDRIAAKQPSWNTFLQLGIGETIADLLRRFGVRLRDQEYNHPIACAASKHEAQVATVDFSSASDLFSIELVRWLLPDSWFQLLMQARSEVFWVRGQWHRYEKISAMGNGFTFPLESLIFYAIARACCNYTGGDKKQIRVYGDDVVIPQSAYCLFAQVTRFAGFKINTDKTFVFGPFRETCGRDFLAGVDVRPVYMDKYPTCASEVYSLYNRLRTNAWPRTAKVLRYLHSLVHIPLYGPWYTGNNTKLPGIAKLYVEGDYLFELNFKPWKVGQGLDVESYFIDDRPRGKQFWDENLQKRVYTVDVLRRKARRVRPEYLEKFFEELDPVIQRCVVKATLLLGADGRPCNPSTGHYVHKLLVHEWPDLRDIGRWQVDWRTECAFVEWNSLSTLPGGATKFLLVVQD